ncbi:MAG: hypothetical protein IKM68_02735 [Bacteroidaceae bacterium]|jgi:hypothetical protein|nr:hypothetical protein [Bacteroidaceae bacterium]
MANLKSGLTLREDENLVMELEAELWAQSMNPIARIIGSIVRLLNLIIGNKRKGFIVITDKRVMEIIQFKACWILNTGKEVKYVLPSSVKEVGYTKQGTFFGCLCQQYNLYYESFTQSTSVMLPVTEESEAQKVVDAFYKAITAAQ